jgi:GTP-binding protein Era
MMETTSESAAAATRTGYVAVVGRPNAGKSTLLNTLVGSKLSVVTAKAQTTWQRVTGIRTADTVQMIFLDTPGLLEVRDLHQRAMLHAAHEALREADVVLFVVDATRPLGELMAAPVEEALAVARAPVLCAVNKIDAADAADVQTLVDWCDRVLLAGSGGVVSPAVGRSSDVIPISAAEGTGTDELLARLEELLPPGPFLYPPDDLASQPVRFFVAELVRETVFERYEEEIPYSVAVRVEEFRESQDPVYIGVTLLVERESQKGILIGKGGRAIRALGTAARQKIETFLERPVYLDLWVKPLSGWRRKALHLSRLGYRFPDDEP